MTKRIFRGKSVGVEPTMSRQGMSLFGGSLRVAVIVLIGVVPVASSQVQVNQGQVLDDEDLLAGIFAGQLFSLGLGTVFDINEGGVLAPLGGEGDHFDFLGSAVNIYQGGTLLGGGRGNDGEFRPTSYIRGVDLVLHAGSEAGWIVVEDSAVDIAGGEILEVDATGTNVEMRGFGADVAVLQIREGSTLQMSGGAVKALGLSGGEATIAGGFLASFALVGAGPSTLNLVAGAIGPDSRVDPGNTLNIFGGEFALNGAATGDISPGLGDNDLFTATLSDGSVLILHEPGRGIDTIHPGTTSLHAVDLEPIDATPMVIASGEGPKGLRAGQALTVTGVARLRDGFAAVGATLNIHGGSTGDYTQAAFSEISIHDAVIGGDFYVYDSVVDIVDSWVGHDFRAYRDSVVNIESGSFSNIVAESGSVINFSGGEFRSHIFGFELRGGTVNISGGAIDIVGGSGNINFFGTRFFVGGVEILDLTPFEAYEVDLSRNVRLDMILADGTIYTRVFGSSDAFPVTLTFTLVPAPGTCLVLGSLGLATSRRRRTATVAG